MLKTRLVNAVFILAIIFGLGLMFLFIFPFLSRLRPAPRIASTPSVLQRVQGLSELITVKYVLEKVVIFEDPRWYPGGDSRVLMVVHGNVLAGVNLKELREGDIRVEGDRVFINLPPARAPIDLTYIDDKHTQVVERSTGILRSFDKDMEQNARKQAILDLNLAARESGILNDAAFRARQELTNLLSPLGFKVEINSR